MSPEEDQTRDTVDCEPKHYQLSYSGPLLSLKTINSIRRQTQKKIKIKTNSKQGEKRPDSEVGNYTNTNKNNS